ncbi:MAG: hypothetical protein IPK81_22885 [Rhodospirillales bacterium]|nr:hypothetical protein [Rhodospirillales bacterium]QQS12303.1 MAG: hypothetical protein IPK81_22885 [Rhodospirillales bacterium]
MIAGPVEPGFFESLMTAFLPVVDGNVDHLDQCGPLRNRVGARPDKEKGDHVAVAALSRIRRGVG